MPTYTPKASEITRAWHVIDADGLVLGRLCTEAARLLRGKHKPTFAPHIDTGDHVVIINADKVVLHQGQGRRQAGVPLQRLPGRPEVRALRRTCSAASPTRRSAAASRGMLPKGPLGRQMIKKLKVYAGPEHPHAAQTPSRPRPRRGQGPLSRDRNRTPWPTNPLTQTTGRRKEAVARARLRPGTGKHTINGKPFDAYFTTAMQRMVVTEALRVTEAEESYDIDATMHGGGISGQAGALRMAIARVARRARSRAARPR